jgi:hypothetical protein
LLGLAKRLNCFVSFRSFFFQPYVTELDLHLAQVPKASVDFLTKAMPRATAREANGTALDFDGFLDDVYGS